jgi:outer membrane protein assembly factor BamB
MSIRIVRRLLASLTVSATAAMGLAVNAPAASNVAAVPPARQESATGVTHGLLALGNATYILGTDGTVAWTYPAGTRDGFVLPGGNVLLALSKGKEYPGGGAVEVTRDGKVVWSYRGTQAEVNTVQKLADGRYMVTEAGPKPRVLEVDAGGKVVSETPIAAQTKDLHLQTRMARKLSNGHYLVPQLLDKVVREYAADGTVAWEAKTPDEPKECWPFTAIRLADGHTLVTLTHGAQVVEFDAAGKVVWQLTNADLPTPLLKDTCGAQRLPNGNTVVASYGQGKPGEVKLLEVTPDKKVVWTLRDDRKHGIHEFQILDAGGKPVEPVMK